MIGKNARTLIAAIVLLAIGAYAIWSGDGRDHSTAAGERAPAATPSSPKAPTAPGRHAAAPAPAAPPRPQAFAFGDLKARAQSGDAVSQRELAELYERCFAVNIAPENYLPGYEVMARHTPYPEETAEMMRTARSTAALCAKVDGGQIIPIEAIRAWLESAATRGDLAAQARLLLLNGEKPDAAAYTRLMDDVARSKDPAAVFRLGELVAHPTHSSATGRYADLSSDPISGHAWSIVGCRMGYDCSSGSPLMASVCLSGGGCAGENYEAYVRSSLITARDARLLDLRIREVSALLAQP